jgi:hypothetical protein
LLGYPDMNTSAMRSLSSTIFKGVLLATFALGVGCSANTADDSEASGSNEALAANETVLKLLVSQVASLAPQRTGVDSYDFVIVKNGGARYLVVIGYNDNAGTRTPVVELLVPAASLEGDDSAYPIVKRSPNPSVPLHLSEAQANAMTEDFQAMRSKVEAVVASQCASDISVTRAWHSLTTLGAVAGAVACIAATDGLCVVLAGGVIASELKTRHNAKNEACPTQ